jgi:fatty acid desaturase
MGQRDAQQPHAAGGGRFAGLLIGWHTVLMVHLPIVLLAGAMGVWLFYVQHTYEGAYWTRKEDWDAGKAAVSGSSYFDLPAVLHWFTGNIGYHHIHHLGQSHPELPLARGVRVQRTAAVRHPAHAVVQASNARA